MAEAGEETRAWPVAQAVLLLAVIWSVFGLGVALAKGSWFGAVWFAFPAVGFGAALASKADVLALFGPAGGRRARPLSRPARLAGAALVTWGLLVLFTAALEAGTKDHDLSVGLALGLSVVLGLGCYLALGQVGRRPAVAAPAGGEPTGP
jgi:hypothetical protein